MISYNTENGPVNIFTVEGTQPPRICIQHLEMDSSYIYYKEGIGYVFTSWDGGETFFIAGEDPLLCLKWYSMGITEFKEDEGEYRYITEVDKYILLHIGGIPDKDVHFFDRDTGLYLNQQILVEYGTPEFDNDLILI